MYFIAILLQDEVVTMTGLEVPLRRQEGKVWCGPACAQMVLAYHGIRMSQKKIVNQLPMIASGVDIAALGRFFITHDFDVKLKFWVRDIQPRWLATEDPELLRKILKQKLPGYVHRDWNWYRNRLLKFVDAGGNLVLEPVWAREVYSELQEKRPVILNINNRLLSEGERSNGGHYVIPTYITEVDTHCTKPMISFIDPWEANEEMIYLESVMLACHMWFGSCLFIKPKKS